MPLDDRITPSWARQAALAFGGVHAVVCAAGLVFPRAYGLGIAQDPTTHRRLRLLALCDLPFAATVALAVARGGPVRRPLLVGAGSDVARAALLAVAFRGRAPRSRRVLIAASLLGSATALALSARVDLHRAQPAAPGQAGGGRPVPPGRRG